MGEGKILPVVDKTETDVERNGGTALKSEE
jgi:hypothetical protein